MDVLIKGRKSRYPLNKLLVTYHCAEAETGTCIVYFKNIMNLRENKTVIDT